MSNGLTVINHQFDSEKSTSMDLERQRQAVAWYGAFGVGTARHDEMWRDKAMQRQGRILRNKGQGR